MTHENITFNDNNTMSTTPSHPLVWQEHLSEGRREDDEVVMLNIAMLVSVVINVQWNNIYLGLISTLRQLFNRCSLLLLKYAINVP